MNKFCSKGPWNGQNECIYVDIAAGDETNVETTRVPCVTPGRGEM